MTKHHPVMWLKGRATTGLKDMPGNAAWVRRQAAGRPRPLWGERPML
jgi:hypothetical protein